MQGKPKYGTLYIGEFLQFPFRKTGIFFGGCRPPDPPLGRTDGRAGAGACSVAFSMFIFLSVLILLSGVQALGGILFSQA